MLLIGIFGLIMLALGILSWLIFDQRLQAFGPVKNKIKTNSCILGMRFASVYYQTGYRIAILRPKAVAFPTKASRSVV